MNNISFIIPSYNSEKTLEESVDSIFNGNFINGDEVIIIDDCSTDKSLSISKKLADKYSPNIIIIKNEENRGCPASRNIGIKSSKNELIFNLDSDNILPKNSIELLRKTIKNENADVVSFQNYFYFREDTSKITHKWLCKDGIFTLADLFSGMISPAPGGNFLYKKSIWSKVGGYWEYGKGLHEAWGFSFKLLVNGAKFFVVENTFYYHRYSHDSLFTRENRRTNESIRVTNKFIENNLNIFSEKTTKYIKSSPDWFNNLEKKPLELASNTHGKNGKIVFTSNIKQIIYLLKSLIR